MPACSCIPSNDTRCARDGCRDDEDADGLLGDRSGDSLSSAVSVVDADSAEDFGEGRVVEPDVWPCEAEMGDETGCAICAGGTAIRNAATGELAGVGCLDLRSSSSSTSGMGDGTVGREAAGGLAEGAWIASFGRSADSDACDCCCCW